MPKRKPTIIKVEAKKTPVSYIHMRINPEEKQHYVDLANEAGVPLTVWIKAMLKWAEENGAKIVGPSVGDGQLDLPGTASPQSTNE